jgi:hypothetical protein
MRAWLQCSRLEDAQDLISMRFRNALGYTIGKGMPWHGIELNDIGSYQRPRSSNFGRYVPCLALLGGA